MIIRIPLTLLQLIVCCLIVKRYDCESDVIYKGKTYVSDGEPIYISCIRSAYGTPKWTRNSLAVDLNDPQYFSAEEYLPSNRIRMELGIKQTFWEHRGEYKCDPLSSSSHRVEIVPSKESDEAMRSESRVLLRPNETLKLVCDEEENAVFPINWYKDGKRVLEREEDPRISMESRILRIAKSNESDAGEYMCVIEMSGLSYPFAAHLGSRIKVTFPARVERFPPQIQPILNRNLTLECKVQGFPTPRVAWFVDGIPLHIYQQNDSRYSTIDNPDGFLNSIFVIHDVRYGDNHKVTCAADNMEGSAKTSVKLAVRNSKIITNEEEPGRGVILTPGQELVLQCNNTDDLSAKIQWEKNGMAVNTTDPRIRLEANTLSIEKSIESDCGNYTCISGDAHATIVVRSIVKLGPFDSSRNVVQGQPIVLVCNVTQGIPLPTLQWLKGNNLLNLSDSRIEIKSDARGIEGTELIIADAQFDDRANYTCIASNEISTANASILVRVKDKYAALWPFLGICAEVGVLCTIIFIYEKRRQKPDFDESETEHNTENRNIPDQDEKSRDVRHRK